MSSGQPWKAAAVQRQKMGRGFLIFPTPGQWVGVELWEE